MIPRYPVFKKLELSDRDAVEAHTARLPPYSDFEFGNLWSWDVKGEMRLSELNGNLVVRFTDYQTGRPLLTFLGTHDAAKTARSLLEDVPKAEDRSLHLIAAEAAVAIEGGGFVVEPSYDHLDYICEVARHLDYHGAGLKAQRRNVRRFMELAPGAEYIELDLMTREAQADIRAVCERWIAHKGSSGTSEPRAIERFLAAAGSIPHAAVGIRLDVALIAFHIASLAPGICANALFSKADAAYRGVYAALDQAVAHDLLSRGYARLNLQQDLGIKGLRCAKQSLKPSMVLRKYSVRLRT